MFPNSVWYPFTQKHTHQAWRSTTTLQLHKVCTVFPQNVQKGWESQPRSWTFSQHRGGEVPVSLFCLPPGIHIRSAAKSLPVLKKGWKNIATVTLSQWIIDVGHALGQVNRAAVHMAPELAGLGWSLSDETWHHLPPLTSGSPARILSSRPVPSYQATFWKLCLCIHFNTSSIIKKKKWGG